MEGVAKNNQADECFKKGEYESALRLYKKALEIKELGFGKDNAVLIRPWIGLAETYLKLKDYKNAMNAAIRIGVIARKEKLANEKKLAFEIINEIREKERGEQEQDENASPAKPVYCANCNQTDAKFHCGKCKKVHYCSQDCQKADWKHHRQTCGEDDSVKPTCGLCGAEGTRMNSLTRTTCCNNWICQDQETYELNSFKLNSCNRNHDRYSTCNFHCQNNHPGRWQDCNICMKKIRSGSSAEEKEWNQFVNKYFEMGGNRIGEAEMQRNRLLKTDGTKAMLTEYKFH